MKNFTSINAARKFAHAANGPFSFTLDSRLHWTAFKSFDLFDGIRWAAVTADAMEVDGSLLAAKHGIYGQYVLSE